MNELKEISELIPEETKKEIYKDGVKPTMIEAGKTLSLVPRVVKNALAKVEMWCINREFMVKEFELELQKKLEEHKAENIVDADPSIFIPSAQAISYNWDKEDIKQLYLNLMASDMDKTKKSNVHPSFSEVIKQMDSTDVKIFTKIYNKQVIPLYVLKKSEEKGTIPILDYLLSDDFYTGVSENKTIKSLNNLERLKLIEIIDDEYYIDDKIYLPIENGKNIIKYKNKFLNKLDITKGMIKKTEFGKDFFDVCCK
jgi:hypothetical protein